LDRREYWNKSYTEYWLKRVGEAKNKGKKSKVIQEDSKTESDTIYDDFFKKHPLNKGKVLDVGCAWGRMFDIYLKYDLEIFGVDISQFMIKECAKNWKGILSQSNFSCAEAEKLPFENNSFDNLVCLATFDATYQQKSLSEFFRVLKLGGRLYLTGKNSEYFLDDKLALAAEIGARKKNHPNYFTNVRKMIAQINKNKNELMYEYYFKKRGDFANFNFKKKMPNFFYEYFLVFKKSSNINSFSKFSDKFSETFLKKNRK
tara:strand:+ start:3881 stop:4657 length:777 start_codon:yes stop_codon:yes gene_type:complete